MDKHIIGVCNTRSHVADVTKIEFRLSERNTTVNVDVHGVRGFSLMGFWLNVSKKAFFAEAIRLLEENGYVVTKVEV